MLFSFVWVKYGLHTLIRHSTNNSETISKYSKYIDGEESEVDFDDLNWFYVKMLSDVIEALIGAILIDSCRFNYQIIIKYR